MKKLTTVSLIIFAIIATAILTAGLVFYQNRPGAGGSGGLGSNSGGSTADLPGSIAGAAPPAPAGSGGSIVSNPGAVSGTGSGGGNPDSGSQTTLNLAEIAKHNTAGNCWLLISGKIYNATSYLSLHPGGAGTITPYCGRDGTTAFATKDMNRPHSSYAASLLANYFVGNLNQVIGQVQAQGVKIGSSGSTAKPVSPAPTTPAKSQPAAPSAGQAPAVNQPSGAVALNATEAAKHNSAGDCWLIISNKIYNATSYLNSHPGGVGAITAYCGRDATQAFATKGGGGAHSSYAYSLLANYYIGDLGQTAPQSQVQQNINSTNQTPAPAGGGGENEYEDD